MSITGELEAIWSDYDLDELASEGAKFLSRGSSTDWGLPADIEPRVPPITRITAVRGHRANGANVPGHCTR